MTEMQNVDDYRQQIFQCLVAAVTTDGAPRYTEEQARALAMELTYRLQYARGSSTVADGVGT